MSKGEAEEANPRAHPDYAPLTLAVWYNAHMDSDQFGEILNEALDKKFAENLQPIERRLGNIEKRLRNVETDVNTLKIDVTEIKQTMATSKHLDAVARSFATSFVQKTVDHEVRITNLEEHTELTSAST